MASDESTDPLFRSALREFKAIILVWLVHFVWVIGYCSLRGYGTADPDAMIAGIPAWAFWGVGVPWLSATAVTVWFALFKMEDHPLPGPDRGERSSG